MPQSAFTVQHLIDAMEAIAPPHYAESWDNIGLLLGSADQALTGSVMLTIDLTEAVVDEAAKRGCSAIVAYHPPVFNPLTRITDATGRQRVALHAIRAGLAVYAPHTALDAVEGGVTDWLADGALEPGSISGADRRPLVPWVEQAKTEQVKVVTFAPADSIEAIRSGLASVGAGRIGDYELCSFSLTGIGTFMGNAATTPAIGEPEVFQETAEVRLEMVCPESALPLVTSLLRQFHPYEEPPIDFYRLMGKPHRAVGVGRRLMLDQATPIATIANRLKAHLGARVIKSAAANDNPISTIGVVPGAGASLADAAFNDGCDLFITGEMKHHEVLAQLERGMSIMLCGHTTSERGYLHRLAQTLDAHFKQAMNILVSEQDKVIFDII